MPLTFSEYQRRTADTAIYPDVGRNPIYPTLGLAGEAGEVCEKVKKVLRDSDGQFSAEAVGAIQKELGDLLWYAARLARAGARSRQVAEENLSSSPRASARSPLRQRRRPVNQRGGRHGEASPAVEPAGQPGLRFRARRRTSWAGVWSRCRTSWPEHPGWRWSGSPGCGRSPPLRSGPAPSRSGWWLRAGRRTRAR